MGNYVATIYGRDDGDVLWCRVKDPTRPSGKQRLRQPTPYRKGQERDALKYAKALQEKLDLSAGDAAAGPITVAAWAESWLAGRRERFEVTRARYDRTGKGKVSYRDYKNDEGRMRKHVLPRIGAMLVENVRPKHLVDLFRTLRTETTLSPKTLENINGLIAPMFDEAAFAGLIEHSPAILTKKQVGSDDDDGDDDDGAGRYTREQFELMIGSCQLTEHSRVFAALGGLGGLRLGAIAGLRWSDLDTTATPLWRLTSSRTYAGDPTKSGKSSVVPVHPVLAEMLASWRHGWGLVFGRVPTPDDPIVPRAPGKWIDCPGTPHTKKTGGNVMDEILATLRIPAAPKKTHALRSTFISLALEDKANRELIKRITHTTKKKGRDAFERYDRAEYWPLLCDEVLKMRITPKSGGEVVALSTVPSTVEDFDNDSSSIEVEAPGVEGRDMPARVRAGAPTERNLLTLANARALTRTNTVFRPSTVANEDAANLARAVLSRDWLRAERLARDLLGSNDADEAKVTQR